MLDINEVTAFLGWCTAMNLIIYVFSALCLTVLRRATTRFHSRLTGLDAAELPKLYFAFLGNYKIAILVFNLTPYMALKLMF